MWPPWVQLKQVDEVAKKKLCIDHFPLVLLVRDTKKTSPSWSSNSLNEPQNHTIQNHCSACIILADEISTNQFRKSWRTELQYYQFFFHQPFCCHKKKHTGRPFHMPQSVWDAHQNEPFILPVLHEDIPAPWLLHKLSEYKNMHAITSSSKVSINQSEKSAASGTSDAMPTSRMELS